MMTFNLHPVETQVSKHFLLTSLILCQYGNPRSRAKDQNIREDDARRPTVDEIPSTRTMEAMIAVPGTDFVASRKTWMNGKPNDVCNTVVGTSDGSPRQNKTAISIANPRAPFMPTLKRIARGMTTAAFLTSSARCTAESAPTNAYTAPTRPIKKE